jgi:cytochrome c oxidase subunit 3
MTTIDAPRLEPLDARRRSSAALDPARLGLWVFLATVAMLFAAFASAYLVRMASGSWTAIPVPAVLWATTAILLASSAALETARLRVGSTGARWIAAALVLGLLFLAGQAAAWRSLQAAGVFLPTSPHAAFLYVFTALHGAHLLGGLIWLAAVLPPMARWERARVRRESPPVGIAGHRSPSGAAGMELLADRVSRCATYWHFMSGLWVFLFAVLHLG